MNRLRIGAAVGERGVTLVVRVRDVVHRADAALAGSAEDGAAIAAAMQAAGERLETLAGEPLAGARVDVALLPPLVDARLVRLPPLRRSEAEAVLRRDAARHFVGGAGARVVAVADPPAKSTAEAPGTFAVAASLNAVEAVRAGVAAAGWRAGSIVAAQSAWLAALPSPARDAESADVVIAMHDDAAHVIRREGDVITAVRRVPVDWHEQIVAAAGGAPGRAVLFADGAVRESMARALRAAGWTLVDADRADAPAAAATFASRARLPLISPMLAAERRDRQRSIGMWIAAAALVLLVAAAALELWGTRRELETVRARRAAIQDDVAPLLATRDSLAHLDERIAAIRGLADGSPRWTRAVFDMALLLPPDARLTRFTTSGDTLFIEAAAARAGAALQALRTAGSIDDVRMDGAVLRDLQDGETVVERFRIRAVLSADGWTPPAPAAVEVGQPAVSRGEAGERTAKQDADAGETNVRRSM